MRTSRTRRNGNEKKTGNAKPSKDGPGVGGDCGHPKGGHCAPSCVSDVELDVDGPVNDDEHHQQLLAT